MYSKDHYSSTMKKYISREMLVGDLIEKLEYEKGGSPQVIILIESQKMADTLPNYKGECPVMFHGDIRFLIEYEDPFTEFILSRNVRSWLIDTANVVDEFPQRSEGYIEIHIFVD